MIITLQEDGVLRIYPTTDAAVFEVEPLDAEETFLSVFDDAGQRFAIHWIRPNVRNRGDASNGEYEFVPNGPLDPAALLALLRRSKLVDPKSFEPWLRALESRLTGELG